MLKQIFSPRHNCTVKMGRKRPVPPAKPPLKLSKYMTGALPTPPAQTSYSTLAQRSLSQLFDNDQLGDCVIAGGYHLLGLWSGNAGNIFVPNETQIIKDYSAIGGYVPGNPATDGGCDEITAIQYWEKNGFANGDKVVSWMTVDTTNPTELKLAIYLFENIFYGVELPDAWINPMPSQSGFTWDVAGPPDMNNGHCVVGTDYTPDGIVISTWGMLGLLTWRANAQYMVPQANGNAYVLLSQAQMNKAKGKAPNGLDWTALINDYNAMGGNVPAPTPTPTPTPTPVSTNVITIDPVNHHVTVPSGVTVASEILQGQIVYNISGKQLKVPRNWAVTRQ
jgi:hypothetical protein